MRIIAGEFRSRTIETPRGWATRPTSDRLRETLFNVLGGRVAGARFLDLYAGSGANGLEALSRGAREAVLVERAAQAVEAIRSNVAALGVGSRARVETTAVRPWLARAARGGGVPFDLVFLDPPYEDAREYAATLEALGAPGTPLLAPGALVVAEHRRLRTGAEWAAGGLRETRLLEQGDAALRFFEMVG